MAEGTMIRSLLTKDELKHLKNIAEERGMSPRGLRDYALREVIRKDEETKRNRVAH